MTWTSFGLWLCLGYLAYYGLNLAFDLLISRQGSSAATASEEPFFEEASSPELVSYLEDAPVEELPVLAGPAATSGTAVLSSGLVSSTGGMSIAELLIRAKDELIEHTRAIPY